jgi:hypothetical protein
MNNLRTASLRLLSSCVTATGLSLKVTSITYLGTLAEEPPYKFG